MIPFKGRSSMKQYMPKKPVKRGFKIWMRADAVNGYVSELDVYVGKKKNKVQTGLDRTVVENLITIYTLTIFFHLLIYSYHYYKMGYMDVVLFDQIEKGFLHN